MLQSGCLHSVGIGTSADLNHMKWSELVTLRKRRWFNQWALFTTLIMSWPVQPRLSAWWSTDQPQHAGGKDNLGLVSELLSGDCLFSLSPLNPERLRASSGPSHLRQQERAGCSWLGGLCFTLRTCHHMVTNGSISELELQIWGSKLLIQTRLCVCCVLPITCLHGCVAVQESK